MGAMLTMHANNTCGAYAVLNAINALDGIADYDTVARLAGTSFKNGTSRRGIQRALKELGYSHAPYFTRNADNGWRWLYKNAHDAPIVILTDDYGHYCTVTGTMNSHVILVDPSVSKDKNVFVLSRGDLLSRWGYLGRYWAVKVQLI